MRVTFSSAVLLLALALLRRSGPLPLLLYYAMAYGLGLVVTVIVQLAR